MDIYDQLLDNAQPAVPPQPLGNPEQHSVYDDLLDQQQAESDQWLRKILDLASQVNPDQAAQAANLAKKTTLPIDVVERNLQETQRRTQMAEVESLVNSSPILKRQLFDPAFTKIAHDDIDNLSAMESALKFGKDSYKTLGAGVFAGTAGVLGGVEAVNKNIGDLFDPVIPDGFNPWYIGADSLKGLRQNQQDWSKYLTPEADTNFGKGVISGAMSLAQNIPMMAAAVYARDPKLALNAMAAMSFGTTYGEDSDLNINTPTATLHAAANGLIEKYTEGWSVNRFFADLKAGSSLIKTMLHQAIPEFGGEQVATATQGLTDWVVQHPDRPLKDYLKTMPDAAEQTFWASVVGGGAMAGLHKTIDTVQKRFDIDLGKTQQVEQHALNLEQLNQLAAASKVLKRSPEVMKSFIDSAIEDSPVQNLYIDARTFAQTGVADQVAAALPGVAAQMQEALATGGEIRIPVSDYVTSIAGTDAAQALTDHLRVEGEEFTRAEAQTYMQTHAEELQQEVERQFADKQGADAFAASQAAVKATVLEQLNTLNRFSSTKNELDATLISARMAVRAAQLGITPEQMYEKQKLNFAAEDVSGGQVFRQVLPDAMPDGMEQGDGNKLAAMYRQEDKTKSVLLGQVDSRLIEDGAKQSAYLGTFSHSADQSALNHIRKNHGDETTEEARGQLPVTDSDIAKISDIIKNYDSVRFDLLSSYGKPAIAYVKQFNDGVLLYMEEVHNKRHDLAALSMRKYPATADVLKILQNASPNVRNDDGHGHSIGKPPKAVNTNDGNNLHQQQLGSFNPATNTIAIFKKGNLSTVLHELGHFFFENDIALAAELMAKPELTPGEQSIVNDVSALLNWHGIQGTANEQINQWYSMDFEQTRGFHERTAEAFEAYLFTGKAPSIELQHAFQTFRTWLTHVYKSLKAFLETHPEAGKINDDVRNIFDRMLASEDEIKLAEKARSMMPLFESAEKAGMTEADFAGYQALGADATNAAIEALQAKGLRDMQWMQNAREKSLKKMQKQHDELRREVRAKARIDVMSQPIYQAYSFLTGKLTEDSANPENPPAGRFDLAALQDMDFPPAVVNLMVNLKMTAKEGLFPDLVSDLFGFSSGDELVNALAAAENPKAAIEKLTDERMLQDHAELATPEAIERAADVAVHNDVRARFITTEANALAKATGSLRLLGNAAKEYAEAMISRLKIRDIQPMQYSRAEIKAARAAAHASQHGDIEQAAIEKRNQVLNLHARKAAYEAQDDVDAGIRKLKKLQTTAAQGNMRGDFLAQLNALLARFDLRTSLSLKAIDAEKAPLAQWILDEASRLDAVVPELPGFMLNEDYRKHYKDLTVDEFRGLMDGIKQLEFMARREQKQYMEIRKQNFEQERDSVLAVLQKNFPDAFDEEGHALGIEPDFVPTLSKALSDAGDGFIGEFLNAENIIDLLERGQMGPVFDSLFGRLTHRSDWKAERLTGIYQQLKPLFKAYSLKEGRNFSRKGIDITAISTRITRENAVMTALLYGNAEGRDRLANYGWGDHVVQEITSNLTDKDIDLVEGIWALFDHSLWPELKALNERTRGQSPPKVEAVPYSINGRPVTGGYMRLKYDTKLDERSKRLDEGQAVRELLGGGLGMSSKTNQGTSNQRVQGVKLRPRLDLGVFTEAIAETVHDIAYREAIADTMRMLNDRDIQNAIKLAQGIPAYDALVTRVREVAAPPRNPSGWIEKLMSIARKNTVIAMMSGVTTALQNLTGYTPAIGKSLFTFESPALMVREIAKFYSPQMNQRIQFVMENSAYMRGRFGNFDRDLSDMTRQLTVNGNILPSDATFLWLMSAVDRAVAVPVWSAAFADGMQKFDNDNIKATDYADHFVRQTQGSGRDVDLSQIMAGHGAWGQLKKVFTMFQSYFNAQLGLLVTVGAISKHEAKTNPALATAKFTAQFIAIVVVSTVLTELLMHGPGDDDEPEEMAKHWGRVFLRYGASMFPLVRDVVATGLAVYMPDGRYNAGFRLSPIESAGETAIKVPGALYDIFTGEGTDSDTRTAIMGVSVMSRMPGKLISDTVRGTNAWLSGEAGPQAVILGPPPKH